MSGMPGWRWPQSRQRDGWFRVGQVDATTTALLVGLGVMSMLLYAIDQEVASRLGFYGPLVRDGEFWRVATWPLLNPPREVWVVLTLVFFWIIGHYVEERIGRRPFTALIAAMTIIPTTIVAVLPGLASTGVAYGLGFLGTGLLVLFAASVPNAPFLFNIPVWTIAAVFVFIDVLRLVSDRIWGQLAVMVGVIVVAVVGGRLTGMVEAPQRARRPGPTGVSRSPRSGSGGPRVIHGPWGEPAASPPPPPRDPLHASDQATLDRLLDKIASSGMDALSPDERAQLEDLSRRLRGG